MTVETMQSTDELTLVRDTTATIIPAGDEVVLPAGTRAMISQALGGTVTIRTDSGLYRLASKDWDSLGEAERVRLEQAASESETDVTDVPFSESLVWEAMKNCYDPEIPINIVDLGLIYDLKINDADASGQHAIEVKMTLTAQGCGMGPVIADDARQQIEAIPQVSGATVDIVWEPAWTPHMISEEGRQKLGID